MKNKDIAIGAVSGGIFALFYLGLNIMFPISLGAGALSYMALWLATRKEKKQIIKDTAKTEYDLRMSEAKEKISEIYRLAKTIENTIVKDKAYKAIKAAMEIYKNLEKNPSDIKYADKFITYYLEVFLKVIKKQIELASGDITLKEIEKTLSAIENALDQLKISFERQLSKMLSDDILDIDTEIALLKKTVKMEGLYENLK